FAREVDQRAVDLDADRVEPETAPGLDQAADIGTDVDEALARHQLREAAHAARAAAHLLREFGAIAVDVAAADRIAAELGARRRLGRHRNEPREVAAPAAPPAMPVLLDERDPVAAAAAGAGRHFARDQRGPFHRPARTA